MRKKTTLMSGLAVVLGLLSSACSPPADKQPTAWTAPTLCGKQIRILALGDGVVSGMHRTNVDFGGTSGAFRTLLWKRLTMGSVNADGGVTGGGLMVQMVGNRCNGPVAYAPDPKVETDQLCKGFAPVGTGAIDVVRPHQGMPGWKLRDLIDGKGPALTPPVQGNLTSWVQDAQPDIVILMPGPADLARQNDGRKAFATATARGPTVELIDKVAMLAPKAHILVANHPPVGRPGQGNDGALQLVRWFNDELVNVQTEIYAGGQGQVKFVDVFTKLDRSVDVSEDPAYPSSSGYERIAAALEDAIRPLVTCK